MVWFTDEAVAAWHAPATGVRGGQPLPLLSEPQESQGSASQSDFHVSTLSESALMFAETIGPELAAKFRINATERQLNSGTVLIERFYSSLRIYIRMTASSESYPDLGRGDARSSWTMDYPTRRLTPRSGRVPVGQVAFGSDAMSMTKRYFTSLFSIRA
jgi:hypothetical protein